MGTYTTLVLKNKKNATAINKRLVEEFGDTYHGTFQGVNYGAFYSEEMLLEDIRFVNEDETGLKQNPHCKRPLDSQYFEDRGLKVGQFFVKISSLNEPETVTVNAIQKWLKEGDNIKCLNMTKSKNVDRILNK